MRENIPLIELPAGTLRQQFEFYANICIDGGYIVEDCDKNTIDIFFHSFEKGDSVFIMGTNGSGKTMLFELLKRVIHPQSKLKFGSRNILDVVLDFNAEGHASFRNNIKNATLFDDIGTEEKGIYYGDRPEVFEKLAQFRYDKWVSDGLRTFLTTNLLKSEIKARYGTRFADRLEQQYTQLIFNSPSKRKLKNFKGFAPINHKQIKSKEDIEWDLYYSEMKETYKNRPKEVNHDSPLGIGAQIRKQLGGQKMIPDSEIQEAINQVKSQKK